MRAAIILILVFVIISCNNVSKEFYKDGSLKKEFLLKNNKLHGIYKEYYSNGKLKEIHHYNLNENIDSSLYFYSNTNENIGVIKYWLSNGSYRQKEFYSNGKIKKEGLVLDSTIVIGKWKYYNDKGLLEETREYLDINNESYLNQVWSVNKNMDTIDDGRSNFIKILFSEDTIELNEPLRAAVSLQTKFFESEKSQIAVYLAHGDSENLSKNFSNQDQIKLDTFYNLSIDTVNQKWYKNQKYYSIAVFGKWFNTIGEKRIRGYVSEYHNKVPLEKDSVIKEERRIYFDRPLYVKDSVD